MIAVVFIRQCKLCNDIFALLLLYLSKSYRLSDVLVSDTLIVGMCRMLGANITRMSVNVVYLHLFNHVMYSFCIKIMAWGEWECYELDRYVDRSIKKEEEDDIIKGKD